MVSSTKQTPKVHRFTATLERMQSRLNWTIIRVPFDAVRAFGVGGQIKVRGEINGFPFRTSLFASREGRHILLVNKRMQQAGRTRLGQTAAFSLELDTQPRVAGIPPTLKKLLSEDPAFDRWYKQLNHSTRAEIEKWVNAPKGDAARKRRAEQIAERLFATMEAEQTLPPVLQVAFARNSQARKGWDCMSPARRRSHLLAIFYYREPESRQRRVEKMLEDAVALMGKHER